MLTSVNSGTIPPPCEDACMITDAPRQGSYAQQKFLSSLPVTDVTRMQQACTMLTPLLRCCAKRYNIAEPAVRCLRARVHRNCTFTCIKEYSFLYAELTSLTGYLYQNRNRPTPRHLNAHHCTRLSAVALHNHIKEYCTITCKHSALQSATSVYRDLHPDCDLRSVRGWAGEL